MPASSVAHKSGEVLYRFRSGGSLSEWMTADQLKACASAGKLTRSCSIQQAGKEAWCPAERVSGLFDRPAPAIVPVADDVAGEDVDSGSGGAPGASPVAGENGGGTAGAAHAARIGESIHHVLSRALLQKVHVIAPDWDEPHDAVLAGVMSDGLALEFEESGTVIYVPWIHVRAVAATSAVAHSTARIRDRRGLTIDVDRIPTAAFFPQ
ncbi:MAG: hypothetical protein O2819_08840 [Planctomycetota bacterium]|nr:hypothetical protein [Planctomycetota bacterium]MDA1106265.1 hypothetical protein [Planctomycetota bacterium]